VLVGTDDEVRETVGRSTEVVDVRAAGAARLPGRARAPARGRRRHAALRPHRRESAEDTVARIAAYAGERPDLPWILGSGWSMAHFARGTPTREALDAVVRDRPALLSNRDGHGAWANSRALELAGLTAATPDPPDGRIERDPTGAPSGTLHEGAVALVERLAPLPTPAEQLAGLLAAQEVMFSYGITAWQDAAVGALFGQPDSLPVYLRAHCQRRAASPGRRRRSGGTVTAVPSRWPSWSSAGTPPPRRASRPARSR
jgi:predicted amidohydrolase YtcJ